MPNLLSKRIVILSLLFLVMPCISLAQDFYKDYRGYLLNQSAKFHDKNKLIYIKYIDTSIKRLRIATDRFKYENQYSLFDTDTVYIVQTVPAFGGAELAVIWNKKASCSYDYKFNLNHWKITDPKLEIKTNASKILKSFTNKFIKVIETGDTAFYKNYAIEHPVLDGSPVQALMGVKKRGSWNFTSFYGDGQALCFDYDLKSAETIKRPSATLHAMVDSLIRKSLHFNIDSVNIAYRNNPNIYNNKQPFPLILLNDNPVTFEYLKKVNLNEVREISILNNRADCIAIFGEIGKYGVVTIKTNSEKTY